jgi:polyhydroxybutyrate depolymerase
MMRLTICRIAAAAGSAMLALTSACAAADATVTLKHQGVDRTAELNVPPSGNASPMPLLIALHGVDQTPEGLRSWVNFTQTGLRERFAVAYPRAIDTRWSYGRPIFKPMPTVNGETVDDVGFIRMLIDHLVAGGLADPTRIYVAGASRGGLMTYTVACALSDRVAAAAALITGMTEYQRADCHPARPIPLMVVAGTDDPGEWYDGALAPLGRLLSVPETMEFWRTQHGCTRETAHLMPHLNATDPTRIRLFEWLDCRSPAGVRLYRVNDGGHQVPSFTPSSREETRRRGLRNRDMETSDEVWKFVRPVSLPVVH